MTTWLRRKWFPALGLKALLALAGCGSSSPEPTAAESRSALLVDDVYSTLKDVESQLPIVPASATVQMGTLDVVSGEFRGLDWAHSISPLTHKPIQQPIIYSLGARSAVLQFSLINVSASAVVLSMGSHTVTVPAGTSAISLDLGPETGGAWTLSAGNVYHQGAITFTRSGINGAGAFTLAALPITLVWEPPQNAGKTNTASMTISDQTSSVLEFTQTNDASYKGASLWSEMSEAAGTVAGVASAVAPVAAAALQYVGGALGSLSVTSEHGTSVNTDRSLGLSTINALTVTTALKEGPGRGDVFFFYRNPRIAWFMLNGNVTTTLLDAGTLVQTTAAQLKQDLADLQAGAKTPAQTLTGVPATTIQQLLAMDPAGLIFTARDAQPRFVKELSLSISGASGFSQSVSHVLTNTDKQTTASYTTTVTDAHKGWLSAVGLAVSDSTGETTAKLTMSSSHTDESTQTQTATLTLSAASGESYNADIYFDRIFGTFRVYQPRVITCSFCGPITIGPAQ